MKKLLSLIICTLFIFNAQRVHNKFDATQKETSDWTMLQEDAKGKAGVS
jgi:hypothetical protein